MRVHIVPLFYSRGEKGIFKKVMFCTKLGNIFWVSWKISDVKNIWLQYSGQIRFFQYYVVEKVFQNLRMRLKFRIRWAMKIKIFVAREIQYFEFGIFSFNSYVYYLTRGFIAPTGAFNLWTRAFNLPTGALNLRTRTFNLATRAFSLLTRGFELVTRGFELITHNS